MLPDDVRFTIDPLVVAIELPIGVVGAADELEWIGIDMIRVI
jgi:hypothetical protein